MTHPRDLRPKVRVHIDRLRLDGLSPTEAREAERALREALAEGLASVDASQLQSTRMDRVGTQGDGSPAPARGTDAGHRAGAAIVRALGGKGGGR